MPALFTVEDIRAIERAVFAVRPSFSVMMEAGEAVADCAMTMTPKNAGNILVIAGGGNNGGDAHIAAAALRRNGYAVSLLLAANKRRMSADAKQALSLWRDSGGETRIFQDNEKSLPEATLIIDGLFGIGLSRPIDGALSRLIGLVNAANAPVLAIDMPSGVSADSGATMGEAVRATRTLTFFGDKPGLRTGDGRACAGEIRVAKLGEDKRTAGELLTTMPEPARLRRHDKGHKGDYGLCLLVGGNDGMLGALTLAARAAAIMGAGKTRALSLATPPPVDWARPDILWGSAYSDFVGDALAVGMGLGLDANANAALTRALATSAPLLLDADALTLIAGDEAQQTALKKRDATTLLTPHPAEAGRLLGVDAATVNADRLSAARQLAKKLRATTILKGAGTVIYQPDGCWAICAGGNPGLARGGSGDVLSGIIAALLAQTGDAAYAARAGVFLHARAADRLAADNGELALNVNDLAQTAATLVNEYDKSFAGRRFPAASKQRP